MLKKVAYPSDTKSRHISKDSKSEDCSTDGGFSEWTPLPLRRAETEPASLISPPTQVVFSEGRKSESPRPYFLRCPSKWSSTPLPSFSEVNATCQTPEEGLAQESICNFQQRLLENLDETVENESGSFSNDDTVPKDSGFESSSDHSSAHDSRHVSPFKLPPIPQQAAHSSSLSSLHDSHDSPSLGAIPRRRSPRQKACHQRSAFGDGLRRTSNKDLETSCSQHAFSRRVVPVSSLALVSKEGREHVDMLRCLHERNLQHILDTIFGLLRGEDLCAVAQVNVLWGKCLESSKRANEERLSFVAIRNLDRENFGMKLSLRSVVASPVNKERRVMGEVMNCSNRGVVAPSTSLLSPNSGVKRENQGEADIISPSKVRHRLFVSEAAKLSPGERLVHCPLCTSPSRVAASSSSEVQEQEVATCSSTRCSFVFCPNCQCEQHVGRACRITRTSSSRISKSGNVSSKKSKARLRRL